MNEIRIAAAIILNAARETLLVRKRGTIHFMQPGGKIGPDESPINALKRELMEELNFDCSNKLIEAVGTFSAEAANEDGFVVVAEVFVIEASFQAKPSAEIAEAVWVNVTAVDKLILAPLTRDFMLPVVARRIVG